MVRVPCHDPECINGVGGLKKAEQALVLHREHFCALSVKKKAEQAVEAAVAAGEAGDGNVAKEANQYAWKQEHQHILADFWEDHPEFYDKSHVKFKDNAYKRAAVESFLLDKKDMFEEQPLPTCECILKFHIFNRDTIRSLCEI